MEKNIEWADVEALIPEDGIEHLRGDKKFIAFVKSDIKRRSANTSVYRKKYREWFSKTDRGLEAGEPPYRDGTPSPTSKALMRHIFLAYAWLRYKPLAVIEPNAKVYKEDYLSVPAVGATSKWASSYSSSLIPDPMGIAKVVEWYKTLYEAAKEERRAG